MSSRTTIPTAALLTAALLASTLTAQGDPARKGPEEKIPPQKPDKAPADDPVAELAATLQRTHRPGGDAVDIETFAGNLRITPNRPGQDTIEVRIAVRFRLKEPLIRYRIEEGGKVIQRGRDMKGMWVQIGADEAPAAATGRAYKEDLEALRRELRLARQLVQFLDPAAFVRGMKDATVGEARFGKIPCRTIIGLVENYPLYAAAGEARRARVKLWISDDRLLAVEARSLEKPQEGQQAPPAELLIMPRHTEQDGLLLPPKLRFFRIVAGKTVPEAVVDIEELGLNPPLGDERFARNKPW